MYMDLLRYRCRVVEGQYHAEDLHVTSLKINSESKKVVRDLQTWAQEKSRRSSKSISRADFHNECGRTTYKPCHQTPRKGRARKAEESISGAESSKASASSTKNSCIFLLVLCQSTVVLPRVIEFVLKSEAKGQMTRGEERRARKGVTEE
jgi:hypothetical protein